MKFFQSMIQPANPSKKELFTGCQLQYFFNVFKLDFDPHVCSLIITNVLYTIIRPAVYTREKKNRTCLACKLSVFRFFIFLFVLGGKAKCFRPLSINFILSSVQLYFIRTFKSMKEAFQMFLGFQPQSVLKLLLVTNQ